MPSELHLPPGPRGFRDILKLIRGRKKDPLQLYLDLVKTHGDLVYFKIGSIGYALVNDPDAIKWVLQENSKNYVKGPGYERLRAILGMGLLTSNGELWKRQRRLAAPAFHHSKMVQAFSGIVKMTDQMLKNWESELPTRNGRLELASEMSKVTLSVVGQALLGFDTSSRAAEVRIHLQEALKFADSRGMVWLRLLDFFSSGKNKNLAFEFEKKLPSKELRDFRRSVGILNEIVLQIIEERRRTGIHGTDLLGSFMEARDEDDGTGMSDQQLRDEVISMLTAGHETTATAITFCWYFLAREPEVLAKVRAEIDEVLKGEAPRFESLAALPYTQQFFSEVLRYYPPFWRVSREAIQDDRIGGFHIPAGTTMILSPLLTHRNPKHWKDPATFRPERFSEAESAGRHKFAYLPFGGGPRVCIGAQMAMMESIVILVRVLQHYDFEAISTAPGAPPSELEAQITLHLKHGFEVKATRRKDGPTPENSSEDTRGLVRGVS